MWGVRITACRPVRAYVAHDNSQRNIVLAPISQVVPVYLVTLLYT